MNFLKKTIVPMFVAGILTTGVAYGATDMFEMLPEGSEEVREKGGEWEFDGFTYGVGKLRIVTFVNGEKQKTVYDIDRVWCDLDLAASADRSTRVKKLFNDDGDLNIVSSSKFAYGRIFDCTSIYLVDGDTHLVDIEESFNQDYSKLRISVKGLRDPIHGDLGWNEGQYNPEVTSFSTFTLKAKSGDKVNGVRVTLELRDGFIRKNMVIDAPLPDDDGPV